MPRASVITATTVKEGDLRSMRRAKRQSCQSICTAHFLKYGHSGPATSPVLIFREYSQQTDKCLINAASSTGRCNTIQRVDSTIPGEPICLTALGENLARVAFRLI